MPCSPALSCKLQRLTGLPPQTLPDKHKTVPLQPLATAAAHRAEHNAPWPFLRCPDSLQHRKHPQACPSDPQSLTWGRDKFFNNLRPSSQVTSTVKLSWLSPLTPAFHLLSRTLFSQSSQHRPVSWYSIPGVIITHSQPCLFQESGSSSTAKIMSYLLNPQYQSNRRHSAIFIDQINAPHSNRLPKTRLVAKISNRQLKPVRSSYARARTHTHASWRCWGRQRWCSQLFQTSVK